VCVCVCVRVGVFSFFRGPLTKSLNAMPARRARAQRPIASACGFVLAQGGGAGRVLSLRSRAADSRRTAPQGGKILLIEGPAKQNRRTSRCLADLAGSRCLAGNLLNKSTPRAFAKSQTHPPTIRLFFSLTFFWGTFLGVSRQGEFKNTTQTLLQASS
jgi:hypothetical protein